MQREQAVVLEYPEIWAGVRDNYHRWRRCRKLECAAGDGGFDAETKVGGVMASYVYSRLSDFKARVHQNRDTTRVRALRTEYQAE